MQQHEIFATGVDRLDGGVLVEFPDGTTAVYSARFLYDALEQGNACMVVKDDGIQEL
jgi:hypothetical protein